MIRFFLLLLLTVLGGWYLADLLRQKGPGYVLIYYDHYSLETSVWVFAAFLMISVGLLMLGYKLLGLLFRYLLKIGFLPKVLGERQARKLQYLGTLAFLDENWPEAASQLGKSAKNSDTPFLNLLMATRASLAEENYEQAQSYLASAGKLADADELSLAMLQLDLALAQKDTDKAEFLLKKQLTAFAQDKRFLRKAVAVYQAEQDWAQLQALLSRVKKVKAFSAEELEQLEKQALTGLLQKARLQKDLTAAQQLWKNAGKLQKDHELLAVYAGLLLAMGEQQEAEKLLQGALKRQWDEKLIGLYAQIAAEDNSKQLALMETLLQSDSHNSQVLNAVARVCLHGGLWGQARHYLEQSLQARPTVEAYQLLARIAEEHNDAAAAHRYLQAGLRLAVAH